MARANVHPYFVQMFMLKVIEIGKMLFTSANVHLCCVQVFMLKFIEIGKVLLTNAVLEHATNHQVKGLLFSYTTV